MAPAACWVWLVTLLVPFHERHIKASTWAALADSSLLGSITATGAPSLAPAVALHEGRRRSSGLSSSSSAFAEVGASTRSSTDRDDEAPTPERSNKKRRKRMVLPRKGKRSKPERKSNKATFGHKERADGPSNNTAEAQEGFKDVVVEPIEVDSSEPPSETPAKLDAAATGGPEQQASAAQQADAAARGRAGPEESAVQKADALPGRKRGRQASSKRRRGTAREGPHPRRASGRLLAFKRSLKGSKGASKSSTKGKNTALLKEPKLTPDSSLDPEDGFPRVLPRPPQKNGTSHRNLPVGCMPVQATRGMEAFAEQLPSQGVGCRLRMEAEQSQRQGQKEQQHHQMQHYQPQAKQGETQDQIHKEWQDVPQDLPQHQGDHRHQEDPQPVVQYHQQQGMHERPGEEQEKQLQPNQQQGDGARQREQRDQRRLEEQQHQERDSSSSREDETSIKMTGR